MFPKCLPKSWFSSWDISRSVVGGLELVSIEDGTESRSRNI